MKKVITWLILMALVWIPIPIFLLITYKTYGMDWLNAHYRPIYTDIYLLVVGVLLAIVMISKGDQIICAFNKLFSSNSLIFKVLKVVFVIVLSPLLIPLWLIGKLFNFRTLLSVLLILFAFKPRY